ncbi:hypothetical protein NMG60_11032922 [Bertholletia excelsa]
MDARICTSPGLLYSNHFPHHPPDDFNTLFNHLNTLLSGPTSLNQPFSEPDPGKQKTRHTPSSSKLGFSSTSLSLVDQTPKAVKPTSQNWLKPAIRGSPKVSALFNNLTDFEQALIGAAAGQIAGALTCACLHPLDTIKTMLQTKGASELYTGGADAIAKTFQSKGILGFYSGLSAVIVGSAPSSAVYFGTCELGKSIFSRLPQYPSVLIPPAAGAMGNIMSSAIFVPKELITQRMQAGAKGWSWQLKAAVLSRTNKPYLEPIQSVYCGALAGAISASVTTPLDVVKTRLMTQVHGEAINKVATVMYSGVSATVKQILKEEGWVGLSRGMGPRVLHKACSSAIGYFAFETAALAIFNQYLKRKESSNLSVVPP